MDPRKKILVHACCASCSSHVLALLSDRYDVSAFFYNPNIQPAGEYLQRLDDMKKVCSEMRIHLFEGEYDPGSWQRGIERFRHLGEKSERCWRCYAIRLDATAKKGSQLGCDLFTSTLSVSPHKIQERIIEEGEKAAAKYHISFLGEDFKKKDGFKISVEKSRSLGLTRQDYCGCLFSREEAAKRRDDNARKGYKNRP
ncbi:MAG: epoxyqueuosine reductase QueH [Candidatus Krumholzibacteriota bacterium]|nr:epoxyqueuosine reductase QueH [Candidatus Krumholzibacteriota bacterium]